MGFTQARGRKERKERMNKLVHVRGRQRRIWILFFLFFSYEKIIGWIGLYFCWAAILYSLLNPIFHFFLSFFNFFALSAEINKTQIKPPIY